MNRWLLIASLGILSCPNVGFGKGAPAFISVGISQPLLVLVVDNNGENSNDPNAATEDRELVYAPDVPTIGSIGLSYNHLSGSYSHNLDGEDEDKLSYTDYRIGLFYSMFGVDASYSEFKRFEITDSTGFTETLTEEQRRRPQMTSRFLSTNFYLFPIRVNFDLDASLEPDELKKTGFGLGLIGSFTQTTIVTPSGLVPEVYQEAFGPDGKFGKGELTSTNAQAAFCFTLAPGPLYFSALVAVGLGTQHFIYEAGEPQSREGKGIADKEDFVLSLGYSAKRSFLSFAYSQESPRYVLKDMSIAAESSNLSTIFGIKF